MPAWVPIAATVKAVAKVVVPAAQAVGAMIGVGKAAKEAHDAFKESKESGKKGQ